MKNTCLLKSVCSYLYKQIANHNRSFALKNSGLVWFHNPFLFSNLPTQPFGMFSAIILPFIFTRSILSGTPRFGKKTFVESWKLCESSGVDRYLDIFETLKGDKKVVPFFFFFWSAWCRWRLCTFLKRNKKRQII